MNADVFYLMKLTEKNVEDGHVWMIVMDSILIILPWYIHQIVYYNLIDKDKCFCDAFIKIQTLLFNQL